MSSGNYAVCQLIGRSVVQLAVGKTSYIGRVQSTLLPIVSGMELVRA